MRFSELALQPPAIKREAVEVPEWGGTFYFTELSALKHQQLLVQIKEARGMIPEADYRDSHRHEAACLFLSKCLEDEDGVNPTAEWLLNCSLGVILRLGEKAMEKNGLGTKIQEVLEKN